MAKKKNEANRSDGRVNVCFRYNGKTIVVTGKSKEDAYAKKAERLNRLKAGEESRKNPTLNEYYKTFNDFRRDKVKESTIRSQTCQFNDAAAVLIPGTVGTFGDLKLSEVKPQDVLTVQKALRDSGRNTTTVNNIIDHVSHVFHRAVLDRTIQWNPCDTVDPLKKTEAKCKDTKHRALTDEEVKKFFSAMSGSYYDNICRMMIQTGLRVGEIGALMMSDFDFKENVLHITKTIARDASGGYFVADTPKTNNSYRDIPLTAAVKEIFKLQRIQNEMMYKQIDIGRPLFRSVEGELLREYFVNREIKRKCKQTGIELFTTHAFRATFATRFIEQRPQDYKILSEILGHADIKITLNLYAAHKSKDLQAAAMNDFVIAV